MPENADHKNSKYGQFLRGHTFLLPGGKQNEESKPITASFSCRNRYQLYATLNATDVANIHQALPIYAYVLSCTPTYENLFCLKASDNEWMQSFCKLENGTFECPLFPKFKTYSDFFKWKIATMSIKITVIYDMYQTTFTTVSRSVTPLYTCPDISSIQENDELFSRPN